MVLAVYILSWIIAAGTGLVVWKWWFKKDEEWEDKQRAFAHVAGILKAGNPDSWLARIFDDAAFSDWSDLLETFFEFAALVEGDPAVLFAEMDHQFLNMLAFKAKDPVQKAFLLSEIEKFSTDALAA